MYGQTWNNINRHITVVWQSVTVLLTSLALLSLVEKGTLGLDMATSIVAVVAGWLVAHTLDASAWFNRNQNIIANIEREFLFDTDKDSINPFLGQGRSRGDMIMHFRLQRGLGLGIAVLMLAHHFIQRVLPGFAPHHGAFDPSRSLPYATAVAT